MPIVTVGKGFDDDLRQARFRLCRSALPAIEREEPKIMILETGTENIFVSTVGRGARSNRQLDRR